MLFRLRNRGANLPGGGAAILSGGATAADIQHANEAGFHRRPRRGEWRQPRHRHGLGLIFGYREIEDVAMNLLLGWFRPGDVFECERTMFRTQAGINYDF